MINNLYHTRRVLLVVLALSGLVGTAIGLILPRPVSGSQVVPSGMTPLAYLPFVVRPEYTPTPTPTPTATPTPSPSLDPAIYDKYGTLQDWDWLAGKYGDVVLDRGTGTASVVEIREVEGTSTLVLWLENSNGDPIEGQEVVFYWPDAPALELERQACGLTQGVFGRTKENGEVGFGMGFDSQYDPGAGETGAHQVWIVTEGTDCFRGLGMLLDNHIHLDSVWRLP